MLDNIIKECCVNDITQAVNAYKLGANRIELCAELCNGGVTPSFGSISVIKSLIQIPIFVILRPREGSFVYSEEEKLVMLEDAKVIRDLGCDGIVFGCILSDNSIDVNFCEKIIKIIKEKQMSCTFHMAFDVIKDKKEAIDILINLGVDRILTRGGITGSALDSMNKNNILDYIKYADQRIIIMPGGGITKTNYIELIEYMKENKVDLKEIHGSKIV